MAARILAAVLCLFNGLLLAGCGNQPSIDYGSDMRSFSLDDAPVWKVPGRDIASGIDVV